ncbi:biotin-dependent carboxyltransferase family protein [Cohnella zeiphila]|uniref:Biotin-dependent carboxyltransferase family protein n=1 Tax=Cohnella zeiphila TaxID=2761120 RepID=A0A7X0SSJ9_9BACL|nr:biotin-dependent carboxyltransferase family protein [Cohnella zeiphila]MBB6734085.1 biotin-dependent carboxyltransferase family protein [Cohnella zeiphila]
MTLTVIKPGLFTTVQDRGRTGWQRFGVSVGGAMDELSLRLANLLVGNPEDAAALEMTLSGAAIRIEKEVVAAVCGADMKASVDGAPLPMWRPVTIPKGSTVTFGTASEGYRTMVAFRGGISVPEVLGSRSTAVRNGFGGFKGRPLQAADRLDTYVGLRRRHLGTEERAGSDRLHAATWFLGPEWRTPGKNKLADGVVMVRVMPGREWDWFDAESRDRFLAQPFAMLAQSDRMGTRLSGPPLQISSKEDMLSEAVTMGTVQVPPDGRPIVLMADRQTTGGYPRIAQAASVDLPVLAQMRPGERVLFRLIDTQEAEALWIARERQLELLRCGLALLDHRTI